jgi:hypothetical protein
MRAPRVSEQTMRLALASIGLTQIAIGVWFAVDPDSFVRTLADYGPADSHFLRDIATFQLGIGIALLAAVGRPAWRAPVLFAALVQSALHTVNHLVDIGETDPGWQGPFNFVSLLVLTIAIAGLMLSAAEAQRSAARPSRGAPA